MPGQHHEKVTASDTDAPTDGSGDAGDQDRAEHGDTDADVALKIFKLTLNEFRDRREYVVAPPTSYISVVLEISCCRYIEGDRRYARLKLGRGTARRIIPLWAEKEFKNLVRIHR
jgi:serine/threonine-protein kinase RIO1